MKTRSGVVLVGGLLASSLLVAQSSSESSLLVLSKRGHTLAIVDPSSLKVLAKVPVGDDPHEVIASTDGRTAYVSNYGGGSLHTLAVVDLVGQKAMPAIDREPLHGPHGLTLLEGRRGLRWRVRRQLAGSTRPPRRSIGYWEPDRIART